MPCTDIEPFSIRALPESKVDCVVASVTDCSSIPEAQEGTFDLAVCGYVLCNLGSKDEVLLSDQRHLLSSQKFLIALTFYSCSFFSWAQMNDFMLVAQSSSSDPLAPQGLRMQI